MQLSLQKLALLAFLLCSIRQAAKASGHLVMSLRKTIVPCVYLMFVIVCIFVYLVYIGPLQLL